ncbi:hypothetical protein E2C01_009872 [Portunus trituberculatus]|uniref:Uncharacterized protein n=1 Tax=Portunus trituberculatus TaxID=210409 RepID=A0A5B7D751_PORTR|nr:hypothetical protein [Portunus trituberculatus]
MFPFSLTAPGTLLIPWGNFPPAGQGSKTPHQARAESLHIHNLASWTRAFTLHSPSAVTVVVMVVAVVVEVVVVYHAGDAIIVPSPRHPCSPHPFHPSLSRHYIPSLPFTSLPSSAVHTVSLLLHLLTSPADFTHLLAEANPLTQRPHSLNTHPHTHPA